jgi:hypothetical protein
MGGCTFSNRVSRIGKHGGWARTVTNGVTYQTQTFIAWDNAREAFANVTDQARHEDGHSPYSGTIATKHDFVLIGTAATWEEADKQADDLIDACDPRIDDKWGPAGCIEVEGDAGGWLFFGWASC